jgi:hypothetical protein
MLDAYLGPELRFLDTHAPHSPSQYAAANLLKAHDLDLRLVPDTADILVLHRRDGEAAIQSWFDLEVALAAHHVDRASPIRDTPADWRRFAATKRPFLQGWRRKWCSGPHFAYEDLPSALPQVLARLGVTNPDPARLQAAMSATAHKFHLPEHAPLAAGHWRSHGFRRNPKQFRHRTGAS